MVRLCVRAPREIRRVSIENVAGKSCRKRQDLLIYAYHAHFSQSALMSLMNDRMCAPEQRASAALAPVSMACACWTSVLILPVFALYAEQLPGGESHSSGSRSAPTGSRRRCCPTCPLAWPPDHLGRKRVIYFGLALFALGSLIAAFSHDIYWVIVGRSIQGRVPSTPR